MGHHHHSFYISSGSTVLTVDGTSLSSRVGDAVIFVSFPLSIELTMGLTIARSTFPACSSSCLDCSWWDQEYPPPGSASPSWEQQTSGDGQVKRVSTHTGFTLNYYKVFQEIAALHCQHSGVLVTWIQSPPATLQSGRLGLREAKQFPGGLGARVVQQAEFKCWLRHLSIRATAFYFLMPSNQVQALCQRKEGQLPEKGVIQRQLSKEMDRAFLEDMR